MISPLSPDLGQFIFGWHFRNFVGVDRPFSLDFEAYRSRIRPEAILQRLLSPLSIDLGGFIPGQFLAACKGVHGIRPRLFSTDNEV
ncbi:unnamed protein product [Linum trigynum]|uniref:Uncharacterized protein n=1 Tax=Linum trigynum TaxID=586398 RepID=A0AAV2GIT7_9ROSI